MTSTLNAEQAMKRLIAICDLQTSLYTEKMQLCKIIEVPSRDDDKGILALVNLVGKATTCLLLQKKHGGSLIAWKTDIDLLEKQK